MGDYIDDHIDEFYPDEELLRCDGFDDCLIGIANTFGGKPTLCYDREAIISKLMLAMGRDDAEEHFEFNIAGAYAGVGTPSFLSKIHKQ